jgi:nucleoid-associated protein YgaU
VVAGGYTLSGIAGEVYGDPGAWRAIADHNDHDDPSRLSAGAVLEIPPLT